MELIRSKVIDTALSQVGYQGSTYSSKYSKELDSVKFYNYPKDGACTWCSIFVDWCIYQNSNPQTADNARSALYEPNKDNCGAGCVQSANYYKSNGAWYEHKASGCPAQIGDKVFFKNSSGIYHTGIVVDWDASGLYTVEGSTGGAKVLKRFYSYNDSRLAGYGRPKYTATDSPVNPDPTPEPYPTPEPTPSTQEYVVKTNGDTLTLRAEPNVKSSVLASIPNGTTIDVSEIVTGESINYNTDWAKTTYNGKTGYCSCNYLVKVNNSSTTEPKPTTSTYKVIAKRGLNVRTGPGTGYYVTRVLGNGAKVTVYETKNGWARIGNKQWCAMSYLAKA